MYEYEMLGEALVNFDFGLEMLKSVDVSAFKDEKHALVFLAMKELHDRGEPVDWITLVVRLKEKGDLEKIGGPTMIAEMIDGAPFSRLCPRCLLHSLMGTGKEGACDVCSPSD